MDQKIKNCNSNKNRKSVSVPGALPCRDQPRGCTLPRRDGDRDQLFPKSRTSNVHGRGFPLSGAPAGQWRPRAAFHEARSLRWLLTARARDHRTIRLMSQLCPANSMLFTFTDDSAVTFSAVESIEQSEYVHSRCYLSWFPCCQAWTDPSWYARFWSSVAGSLPTSAFPLWFTGVEDLSAWERACQEDVAFVSITTTDAGQRAMRHALTS